ncbi:MAG: TetM/TetW/TetO/TetS family tetracycline resistance ribosomal protection protein [Eubacterium sp.]|nr:TetM/TetW/TetO/TetS family tetracycline resistance ribosomal protection protein [Eubacterium sp.]
MKKITIGMLAAVDSGKTTLTEAILYTTGQIRKAGRVDHGDSHLDTNSIERERGITIFSKQAGFEFGGMKATILDTPGHVDFAAEMERTLSVIDYAVLIIGANDGIKAHTATLWKLLSKHRIPVFIFVNKIDLAEGNDAPSEAGGSAAGGLSVSDMSAGGTAAPKPLRQRIIDDIDKGLGAELTDFTDTSSEEFLDDISMISDKAAELVLSDMDLREKREAVDLEIIRLVKNRELFPVYFGSALRFSGVEALISGLEKYTAAFRGDEKGEPSGSIFKVAYDGKDRVTFMKITSGRTKPRQMIQIVPRDGAESYGEKINEIRVYSGDRYTVAEAAGPGEIIAVTGLSKAVPGDAVGSEKPAAGEVLQPYMTYNAYAEHEEDTHALLEALSMLAAEDPKLETEWLSGPKQIVVRIMGAVQLEILTRVIKDRFGISCAFGEEKIIYKETVKGVYEGVGHFEPLRHYAEAHVVISPAERGSGVTVRTECPLELLDINWQNLVMSVLERHRLRGTLIGAPLTDVDICLVAGRASKKHTEGGDFREAALRAVRQGLMQALEAGDMVLLEPWLDFRIETETPEIGAIMTDIDNMGGSVDPPEISEDGSTAVLSGRAPAAGLRGYGARLAGSAHGRTQFSCAMGGYDVCAGAQDVIEREGYAPDRDVRNPADSVFCSHGSGDIVKWDQVFSCMHIPSVLEARRKHMSIIPGGQTDEMLAAEARIKEQRRRREQQTATDKELKAIFEQTYGPIRHYRRSRQEEYDEYEDDYDEAGPSTGSGGQGRSGKAGPADARKAGQADVRKAGQANARSAVQTVTHLFVDGYNLIHAWPELKELADIDFGSARDELTDIICNYSGFMGYETVLVYDAYKVTEGVGSKMRINGITVVYTREHETADAYIERETLNIMKHRKPGASDRILVVTSDNLEQIVSMGHGALRISSHEFISEIGRVNDQISSMHR